LEKLSSRGDWFAKVHTYQLELSPIGANSREENLNTWQIIERLAPGLRLELCSTVFLSYY
jgi:hypothetical protein